MNGIGDSPPRPDGFAKVSGAARYVDDVSLPGMWHGATVRSPHPHARIRSIRFDPAAAPEGTVCVTAADLPGPNGIQLLDDSWPILADGFALHVAEPVALVAAPTRLAARQALAAVQVEYEQLTPVLTLEEAASLPPIYELRLESGDVDAALAGADRVIAGTWRTGHQEHIYIECQGMIATCEEGGGLTVLGSMQCPYYVHKALVHAFGLPEDRVRVRAAVVGGGFGGKEDFPSAIAVHAALLSRACGRPVKMVYDRHEDIVGTSKRHPAVIRHRTGVRGDGRLLALDAEVLMDGGAYKTLSPVVLSRALLHAFGPYRWPSVRLQGKVLRTHTAPNSAFRGFGAPQTQFAVERQMDRVGRALGLDPFEIRARNVVEPGDRLPTGQVLDETTSARLCLEEAERRTGFRAKWRELEEARERDSSRPMRGIGLSLYFHGAGFTGNGERKMKSPVTARLRADGRIEVLTAMTDMGQGCAAVFPQIARAAGGLGEDDVIFAEPDTGDVPDSGPTVASRTTMIVGNLIARTVAELRDQIAGEGLSVSEGWIVGPAGRVEPFRDAARRHFETVGPVEITHRHEPPEWQTFDESTYQGAAYPTYAWGADVVEVEVDPDTLAVRPVAATAVCEVGRAIHPTLCKGQIEGGTLQALGWALLEEVKLQDGRYLNDRLATYIIPTIKDSPRIDVHLLERAWEGGPFGAKGVGELPMDGGAPATAQAVENATGIPVTEIPATPEKLLLASSSPVGAGRCGARGGGGRGGGGAGRPNRRGAHIARPYRKRGSSVSFSLSVNGQTSEVEGHPMERLLDVLREGLGLTGTKEGCGEGECGACTVLIDGEPTLSCLVPLFQCEDRRIETVEGIAEGPARDFLERFVATGGVQCGACTPGIVVTAWALLRRNPTPSREEAREALAGNLCRCTGYEGILRAICPEKSNGDSE